MNFYVFTFLSCLLFSSVSCEKSQVILPLIPLDDSNWKQILTGEWMVKFFAPWCGACRSSEAEYSRLAENSEKLGIRVAEVDITKHSGLAGRFLINSLPTFYHVKDGEFRRYNGERTLHAYSNYVKGKTWSTVESVHWLRHPNSIQMSALSLLFKSSEVMKSLHTTLTVDYGLPDWASYVAFIAGTVVMGLLLGMILVALMDVFTSPMPLRAPVPTIDGVHKQIEEDASDSEEEEVEKEEGEISQEEENTKRENIEEIEKEEEIVDEDKSQEGSESSAQTGKSWEKIPTEGEDNEEETSKKIGEDPNKEDGGDNSKVRKSLRKRKNIQKAD